MPEISTREFLLCGAETPSRSGPSRLRRDGGE
jgi:hypothetical protein